MLLLQHQKTCTAIFFWVHVGFLGAWVSDCGMTRVRIFIKCKVQSMCNENQYDGKVVRVMGNSVEVAIVRRSGCSSCQLSASCATSECRPMVVTAAVSDGLQVEVGQTVRVALASNDGMRSVWLGYGVPLLVFLACCGVAYLLTGSDVVVSCAGLLSVAVYYLSLYLLRGKYEQKFNVAVVSIE